MAKQQCETCKKWFDDEELDDHLEEHLKDQVEEPAPQMLKCSTCNIEMDAYFGVPLSSRRRRASNADFVWI